MSHTRSLEPERTAPKLSMGRNSSQKFSPKKCELPPEPSLRGFTVVERTQVLPAPPSIHIRGTIEHEASRTTSALAKATNKGLRLAKMTNYVLKALLFIPPMVLGFPWLHMAAFVIERKDKVDYSWHEVVWRIFGGLSFSTNAAIIMACLYFFTNGDYFQNENGMGALVFLCAYCGSMSFLCVFQALFGRYHEEREEGGGAIAVNFFWSKLLIIVGIDLDKNDNAVDGSWVWSFSIVSCVIGALIFTIYGLIDDGLNQKPLTGNCIPMPVPVPDGYVCGSGIIYAVEREDPLCCTVTVRPIQIIDYTEQAGAIFFFLYALFKIFATIFVWAENVVIDE